MKGKLRAIDQGTRYDIAGNLRRLIHRIETGQVNPHHVVVGITTKHLDGQRQTETWSAGTATIPEMAYTVEQMRKRLVGS